MYYQVFQLQDGQRPGTASLVSTCLEGISKDVRSAGASIYGIFPSLFGLFSNEIYLVTCSEQPIQLEVPSEISLNASWCGIPTVRPAVHEPLRVPGIYVFRWFEIESGSEEEVIRLSAEAWTSFESDFEAEIQGLFLEHSASPSRMLLLTRYRNLSIWEASRSPAPAARENFLKRHQLTRRALPIATMLAGVESDLKPVSQS